MKIGDKFIKDGETVEVDYLRNHSSDQMTCSFSCVWYRDNKGRHVLTKGDFLEQYKPYEPIYEYQYAFNNIINGVLVADGFYTDKEVSLIIESKKQRLDFTKRERVQ